MPVFTVIGLPLVALGLIVVVRFLANTAALWIADKITNGFEIDRVRTLFLASLIMSILHAIVLSVFK
jgi:uncharacterized membrane protein YvlD (DUF360 family)